MGDMFCFQCQQTAHNTGCEGSAGVCGKKADTANYQDDLVSALIGLARAVRKKGATEKSDELMLKGLFTTITNVNFYNDTICALIDEVNKEKEAIAPQTDNYDVQTIWDGDEDIRSLKSLILFGLKGMAAYAYHSYALGYSDRVFTTSIVSYPEMVHIGEDKDFTPVIEKAIACKGYDREKPLKGINGGSTVTTGFGHGAVLENAGKIVDLVKKGKIRHFFLIGGCDGAAPGRSYYTEFAKKTPMDTIILTLACGKYRLNDLDLGEIEGLPRILDMGQCNDAYSAITVALALAEAFECDVNELPLSMVLSWYEQKAVCILLTLLHLGIKNILLGPTLPAFISPNVLDILVKNYNIMPTSTPDEDLEKILGSALP